MTLVTPSIAPLNASNLSAIQAADTTYALNTLSEMFYWSKGAAKKNSARITATNLAKIEPAAASASATPPAALVDSSNADAGSKKKSAEESADYFARAKRLLDAASSSPASVPALLARQAKQLNAFEFAKLMSAVEETGNNWTESEKYFVFAYPSGSVGSVWLGGCEVYNSIWKNY